MKLANAITLLRILLVVLAIVWLLFAPELRPVSSLGTWFVFLTVLFAAATDFVDGMVARKLGQVSRFGRIMDPLADKLLVCGILIVLIVEPSVAGYVPAWAVAVIVARELAVTSLRGAMEKEGKSFGADPFGKWKMVFQSAYVCALLGYRADWAWLEHLLVPLLWTSIAFTVLSGGNYFYKARNDLEL